MFFSLEKSAAALEFDRDEVLTRDFSRLLELCRVEVFAGTGPGGQHRNRNYTAVRIIFKPSEKIVCEDASNRSQKQNMNAALGKLRIQIACKWRKKAPETTQYTHFNLENTNFALELAKLLDITVSSGFDHKEAALRLGLSNSKYLKELARLPQVWQEYQTARKESGLPELKLPRS